MIGWQEPSEGKRIYITTDNSRLDDFETEISNTDIARLAVSSDENKRVNLGVHWYQNSLYSSNYVGLCRLKTFNNESIYDSDGNELLLKVIPRFNVSVVELLNYVHDDDEFDRYMAPQTISNRQYDKSIEAIDKNELFYFFEDEKPLKVDDGVSSENSIITITVFLSLLRLLCKRPLMGRMQTCEQNLVGKIKGRIAIEKNIRTNTIKGRNDRFYCHYLQLTNDILENQILKAALKKSKRYLSEYFGHLSMDNNQYSNLIAFCSRALRHVSDVQCKGKDCSGLKVSGCYSYYKPVLAMARMVLDDISIESNGITKVSGYVIPYAISMEKLFEVYVRTYLKKNGIYSYKAKGSNGIVLERFDDKADVFVNEDGLLNPGKYISGTVKPDIILTDRDTGKTTIIDVKYKSYAGGNSRNDRLQLLAYSMMFNAENVGIIFPSNADNMIFDERRINTKEERIIKYHQMLLGMMRDDSKIADYIKEKSSANTEA